MKKGWLVEEKEYEDSLNVFYPTCDKRNRICLSTTSMMRW